MACLEFGQGLPDAHPGRIPPHNHFLHLIFPGDLHRPHGLGNRGHVPQPQVPPLGAVQHQIFNILARGKVFFGNHHPDVIEIIPFPVSGGHRPADQGADGVGHIHHR